MRAASYRNWALSPALKTLLVLTLTMAFAPCLARAADVLEIPETCGSATELAREVAALQGSATSAPSTARPEVRLWPEAEGYVLEVELPDGRRRLRDPDCRALFRAAIVIAALGHEESAHGLLEAARAEPARSAPAPATRAPATRAEVAANTPVPVARRPRAAPRAQGERGVSVGPKPTPRPRLRLGERAHYAERLTARALLDVQLGYGLVPELSAIVGAGISLEVARFSARARFAYHTPRTHSSEGEGVRVDALSASLTLELVALPWLRPGLGVDFAALHGRGRGVDAPRSAWATQPTLHASLAVRLLSRGAFWLELCARGLWAPEPARFLMPGRAPVYVTSPWALQGGIVASYKFL